MIRPSTNGHAFQYADGTPYLLVGDTWWATPTFRFRWRDDDTLRPMGPEAGFKEFVAYRRRQEYNCVAILAALPNWDNDDRPASLKTADGVVLRAAWSQAGTKSAKRMTDEAGNRAFLFPGKVPGYERYFPDVERINPAYFQSMDKKIDYLNAQGFVPFIEVARRDIGQAWKKFYPWPESYSRYIQYIWSRYQANVCLFSPIHFDSSGGTIPAGDWNAAANRVIDEYGPPPFGTLAGTNPSGSSLHNWGHVDQARWLGFHQIGNLRTHDSFALLTEIFRTDPPVPAINGEPYYDGMENIPGGSDEAALYCRCAMYGSVLSGGLGGHIYGAGGWLTDPWGGGIWSGEVEEASTCPMWKAFQWPSADQMRHLKAFILSEGRRYQDLIPCADQISPNREGKPKGAIGWAYGARTAARDLFMLYFERDCPPATVSGATSGGEYAARWFNPRTGEWSAVSEPLVADASGRIALPPFPGGEGRSVADWALKLRAYPDKPVE
jgi:YD repeat-containing protein